MPFQTSGVMSASRMPAHLRQRTMAQSRPAAPAAVRCAPPRTRPTIAPPAKPAQLMGRGASTALSGLPSAFDGNLANMREYNQSIADGKDVVLPFGQERWTKHQNSWRHLRHILDLGTSRIQLAIAGPLAWIVAVAVAACSFYTFAPAKIAAAMQVPMTLFTITNATLGLLLVFRTNASYGRWDEARKMWGLMVNRTRDMNRQYAAFFPKDAARAEKRAFMQRWTVAFMYSLKCHLRERGDLKAHLQEVLPPHELQALLDSKHRPLYTLQCLAAGIAGSGASDILKTKMDDNLTAMEDCVGGCERLLRTPIPLPYTRHTTRFLIIWLTLLPFGLFPTCGWATVFVTTMIGSIMLGVEEIGVGIEEPFKILALDALCGTIAANTMDILKDGKDSEHSANQLFDQALSGRYTPVATKAQEPMDSIDTSMAEADRELKSMTDAVQRLESALGQAAASEASAPAPTPEAAPSATAPPASVVSPMEAMALMQGNGAIQLDIRPANVFARDCYTKAVNIPFVKVTGFGESAVVEPMANFISSVQETIDVSTPVVVCGGEHTEGAVDQLQGAGYTVHEIQGGFPEWTKVYNPKGGPRQATAAR